MYFDWYLCSLAVIIRNPGGLCWLEAVLLIKNRLFGFSEGSPTCINPPRAVSAGTQG